jgi:hypothetical protein
MDLYRIGRTQFHHHKKGEQSQQVNANTIKSITKGCLLTFQQVELSSSLNEIAGQARNDDKGWHGIVVFFSVALCSMDLYRIGRTQFHYHKEGEQSQQVNANTIKSITRGCLLPSQQVGTSSSLNEIAGQARNDGFILVAVSFIYCFGVAMTN